MITDSELYRLAIFLGSAAMVLIILYHFFEVNADENEREALKEKAPAKTGAQSAPATTKTR
ncbi:Dolichyl-diphosphooligosaccharide--protein glycosyltransferase subunit 4 [Madurella mycetomatis]|uniref:Dolichyl-diphosphooligosaccharide--protein glycosyltransferase subunit 4 n=1 Tax=Madurella mycetomatis TaxID=100816 RepID=A0A175W1G6_9PEZI|nr:Dolichyl-diphosphooligosaccharide--protein glycosyltransferase subunit 4 [Madurella mycetomatis]